MACLEPITSIFTGSLGVKLTSVHRWCSGKIDPTGDTIIEIVRVLKMLNQDAAFAFVNQYLGSELEE